MKRDEIINVFHNRFKKLRHRYGEVVQDFDVDAIHDFRVEIKKLRAFIRLLNTERVNDHQTKIPARVKEFYRTIGEVRNLQLHQQKVVDFCSERQLQEPKHYLGVLHDLEEKEKQKAQRLSDKVSINHFEKHITHAAPHSLSDESIQYFVLQKQRSLQKLMQDSSDETLHEIRKIFKDLLYTWTYISSYVSFFLPQYFTDSKNIDRLTTTLGDFCDCCIAIDFLEALLPTATNDDEEMKTCISIKNELESNKAGLKKEILMSLQRLAVMPILTP